MPSHQLLLFLFLLWLTVSIPFEIGFDVHVVDLSPGLHQLEARSPSLARARNGFLARKE